MCVYQYLLFNNFLLYFNSVLKSVPGQHKVDKFCNIIKHGIIPFHFRFSHAIFTKLYPRWTLFLPGVLVNALLSAIFISIPLGQINACKDLHKLENDVRYKNILVICLNLNNAI